LLTRYSFSIAGYKIMKVLHTEITRRLNSYISFLERDESYFNSPFHNHPELELVYVREGFGKRIIGNKIENFVAGDLLFMGSNLPHIWINDQSFYQQSSALRAKAIVIYFNKNVFGKAFYDLKESHRVIDFFKRAERGIKITGQTQKILAEKLEEVVLKKDFEKIIGLFEILHILSTSKDCEYILSDVSINNELSEDTDRLTKVYRFMWENLHENINLDKVSEIANLTPQSFCRLFKKRTGMSFLEYLTRVRIDQSCKMLIETDKTIAEIAYRCGFKTVPNFNKLFRQINGKNPKAFRMDISLK